MKDIARVPSPFDEGYDFGREQMRTGQTFPAHLPGSRFAHMMGYNPAQWRQFRLGMVKGFNDESAKQDRK